MTDRKPFAFDTETGLIQDNLKAPPLVCVSWCDGEQVGLLHHTESEEKLRSWLEDETKILVGANIAYDMGVIMQKFPRLTPLIWRAYDDDRVDDVQIRERLHDIADGSYWQLRRQRGIYSLAGLAKRHFGEEMEKDEWRLRYMEFHDIPVEKWPEGAVRYAKHDADMTLAVYVKQTELYTRIFNKFTENYENYLVDSFRQSRAAWWLHLMTAWGICTDQERVARLAQVTQDEYKRLEEQLLEAGLMKRVGKVVVRVSRDTKAAKQRMIDAVGEDNVKRTKTGEVALSREACEESEDESLGEYAEITHLKTLLSKEIPSLKPEVHSSFEVLMETGRTSSRSPNIQNPSRKGGIRECFVPRPGYVFVDSDYDIIELRTFAQVCLHTVKSSRLSEKLNGGFDPHLDLGAQILEIPYEEAVSRKKDPKVKDARQLAKAANFGFPGGMGPSKFSQWTKATYGLDMTKQAAETLRDNWFENWPEAVKYFEYINKLKWIQGGIEEADTKSAAVKQFVSERIRGGCSFTEACNGFFQGLAADIGKNAGFLIARACYDKDADSPLYGSRIVNFIHDQFIVEVPEEIGHECAMEVGRLMRLGAEPFIPDVPATCTPCLASCWSKEAEAVYDDNGRLIPWKPKD